MHSLRELPDADRIRSEGRVEAALEALALLERLAKALDQEELEAVAKLSPVPEAPFDEYLDSVEARAFKDLRARLVTKLETLVGSTASLNDGISRLLEQPRINWPWRLFDRTRRRTGKWLRLGRAQFNCETARVVRLDHDRAELEGLVTDVSTLTSFGVSVPEETPRPVERPGHESPAPSAPRARPSEAERARKSRARDLAEPPFWRTFGQRLLAIFTMVGVMLALFFGIALCSGPPRTNTHTNTGLSVSPSQENSAFREYGLRYSKAAKARALERRTPQVISLMPYPPTARLKSLWQVAPSERGHLVLAEMMLPQHILGEPVMALTMFLTTGSGETAAWRDVIFVDGLNGEVDSRTLESQEGDPVRAFVLFRLQGEVPPSATVWNGSFKTENVALSEPKPLVVFDESARPYQAGDFLRMANSSLSIGLKIRATVCAKAWAENRPLEDRFCGVLSAPGRSLE